MHQHLRISRVFVFTRKDEATLRLHPSCLRFVLAVDYYQIAVPEIGLDVLPNQDSDTECDEKNNGARYESVGEWWSWREGEAPSETTTGNHSKLMR